MIYNYCNRNGVKSINVDVHRLHKNVCIAVQELLMKYCTSSDLKIFVSPIVSGAIETQASREGYSYFGLQASCKLSLWFGIEVSQEFPYNDHILIFHKNNACHYPELIRRVEV